MCKLFNKLDLFAVWQPLYRGKCVKDLVKKYFPYPTVTGDLMERKKKLDEYIYTTTKATTTTTKAAGR